MSGPVMWPRVLPQQVRDDPLRRAEVRIFDTLQTALPGGWHVFYSRPWLGLTRTGADRDGECDFLIAHPDQGILAIEVKGGGISYNAETDTWRTHDRHGQTWTISNPVHQAMKSKHELLRKAKEQQGWPSWRVRFSHGVVFPDIPGIPADLGAAQPQKLFCCRTQLADIRYWIEARIADADGDKGPGRSGMLALEMLLARPFMLRVPLGYHLQDDDDAIRILTPQQFQVLDYIADVRRASAGGGAGTGKTIVACEDARRHADSGRRTLLICRGTALAAELKRRVTDSAIDVLTFEELGAARASHRHPPGDAAEILLDAAETDSSFRYDAIIVDEAQDFDSHWWVALDALLADPDDSFLHAYYDTNQQLYGQIGAQLKNLQMTPVRLNRNLRNTRSIHATAARHYQGPAIKADGPAGVSIERLPVREVDIFQKVLSVVGRLVGPDAVKAEDIAVLVPDRPRAAGALKTLPAGVQLCSIMEFKGLERSVVVVAATREIADQPEMAYVALSRARTHLILTGEAVILDWLAPLKTAA